MPTYDYLDTQTGAIVERNVPSGERDAQSGLERLIVPARVGYQAGAIDPSSPEAMVPKAFKKMEETESARSIAKKVQFSVSHIRRVWAFCIAFLFALSLSSKAADVAPGYLFLPTDTVTSTKLNNAASGTINTSFFTGQAAESSPLDSDLLLVYSASLGGYRRITFANSVSQNTALISGKSESTNPGTNAFIEYLDANTGTLQKINATNLLNSPTNFVGPSQLQTNVAGIALAGGGGAPLRVLTDNSTITTNTGVLAMNFGYPNFHNFGSAAIGQTNAFTGSGASDVKWVWVNAFNANGYSSGDTLFGQSVVVSNSVGFAPISYYNNSTLFSYAIPNFGTGPQLSIPARNGSGMVQMDTNNWSLRVLYR